MSRRVTRLSAMKKMLTWVMSSLLMGLPVLLTASAVADDKEKDEDRLKNCGTVLKEIPDIPDNAPKDLLDKADCVVVFPSVLKAAFVIPEAQFPRLLTETVNSVNSVNFTGGHGNTSCNSRNR